MWPDPSLSRSQEVPSYVKQEEQAHGSQLFPQGHRYPGSVELLSTLIQLLQANPRGSALPLAAVLPTGGRKVNGQVLGLPAASLACCFTHENQTEVNEPLAWGQRAKPLNHTIPD